MAGPSKMGKAELVKLRTVGHDLEVRSVSELVLHSRVLVVELQPFLPRRPRHADVFDRCCCSNTLRDQLADFVDASAQITGSVALAALARLIPVSQIVYGTDFPYSGALHHTQGVTTFFKGEDLNKVERENALRLLPRLKST
jgi:hypothetical protein